MITLIALLTIFYILPQILNKTKYRVNYLGKGIHLKFAPMIINFGTWYGINMYGIDITIYKRTYDFYVRLGNIEFYRDRI